MPPKRRFRPPPQVLRNNGKMCEPAMLYLVISVLGLIMIVMQNTSSDVYCMGTYECERVSKPTAFIIQVFYIAFWTWLLNTLCKNGYKNISWIIVLFPFLLYAAAVFGLASSGVFHVREGADMDKNPDARWIADGGQPLTIDNSEMGSTQNIDVVIGRTGRHGKGGKWKRIRVPSTDWISMEPGQNLGVCNKSWAEDPGRVVVDSGGYPINSDDSKVACWIPQNSLSNIGQTQRTDKHRDMHQ